MERTLAPSCAELVSLSYESSLCKKEESTPNDKRNVNVDEEFYNELVQFVKRNRPRSLTMEERLDILILQGSLRYSQAFQKSKNGARNTIKSRGINAYIAKLMRRKQDLVRKIWSDYIKERTVATASRSSPASRNSKLGVIQDCHQITHSLQLYLQERRAAAIKTDAKDVLKFFISRRFIDIDESNSNASKMALRAVQRYLARKGYQRRKKPTSENDRSKEENLVKRDEYVVRMMKENELKNRRIVYIDESYIYENYSLPNDSLFESYDEENHAVATRCKGRTHCFIAAIVDADYHIPAECRIDVQKEHLMKDTLDVFEGSRKPTKDLFDYSYFEKWMDILLSALRSRNITNSIIIMDNAEYHKKLPDNTPKANQSKTALQEACYRYGIHFEYSDTRNVLWNKLSLYIKDHVHPIIVKKAMDAGHEVLFLPQHYSNLQPIEIVWAIIKSEVGRQYTTESTFKDVYHRLMQAFHNLSSHNVQDCIKKANHNLEKLYKHIMEIDNQAVNGGDNELTCKRHSDTDDDSNCFNNDLEI